MNRPRNRTSAVARRPVAMVPAAAAALLLAVGAAAAQPAWTNASIVQVVVAHQAYNPLVPWQKLNPGRRAGYGIAVGPDRILTTENLVRNHTLVELRQARAGRKIVARVLQSDPDVDLALLEVVPDPQIEALRPVELASSIARDDTVRIAQFNDSLEIQSDEARVVLVHFTNLPRAPASSLSVQLLTQMNVNGEGAAVLKQGRLAGLISSFSRETRTAGVVPYPVIARFLEDAETEPYRGTAAAGFRWKPLVDPTRRRQLGVAPEAGGVMVLSCLPRTHADKVLRPEDVILAVDGHAIDELGYYEDPRFGRLLFSYLVKDVHWPGESIDVRLVRDGNPLEVSLTLEHLSDETMLIPENTVGRRPEYLVDGGMVIREMTGRYLLAHGADWMNNVDSRLVHHYLTRRYAPDQPGQRIVLLASVLPDPVNVSYDGFRNMIIRRLNGEEIANMGDVFRIVRRDGGIERVSVYREGLDLVLDTDALPEANRRIAERYGLSALSYERPSQAN